MKWKTDMDEGATAKLTDGRIDVHRHIHHPGKWLLSVVAHLPDKMELQSNNLEAAKHEATAHLIGVCLKMIDELRKAK